MISTYTVTVQLANIDRPLPAWVLRAMLYMDLQALGHTPVVSCTLKPADELAERASSR